MGKTHFFSGATGFVGGAIVLELLRQTDDQTVCLVRPRNNKISTQTYLEDKLSQAALSYGCGDILSEIPKRCRAVTGDLISPFSNEIAENIRNISEVWHCAASLEYRDKYMEQIFQCNVHGTKKIISLARSLKAKVFNYVSTAYVAGNNVGHIFEDLSLETTANNCYEKSKFEAEKLVNEIQDMHVRILRPSIVIGHSKTHVATSFSGLYGFIREVNLFKYKVSKLLGRFLSYRQLRIRADKDTPLNFIPVDTVATNIVNIYSSGSSRRVFHVTNDCVPSVSQTMDSIFQEMGLREPWYVNDDLLFTSLDQQLDQSIQFYSSYLRAPKTFNRTNTEEALGTNISACLLDISNLRPYIRWYLNNIIQKPSHKLQSAKFLSLITSNAMAVPEPFSAGAFERLGDGS